MQEIGSVGGYILAQELSPGIYYAQRAGEQPVLLELLSVESRQRLKKHELWALSFSHSNIARFLESGVHNDGRPYFASEFVSGAGITEYWTKNAMVEAARLEMLARICDIAHAAHSSFLRADASQFVIGHDGEPRLAGVWTRFFEDEAKRDGLRSDVESLRHVGALPPELDREYGSAAGMAAAIRAHLTRRPKWMLPAAIAAAAIVLVWALVWVATDYRDAKQKQSASEQGFVGLRRILGASLFEVHDALPRTPATATARTMLLDRAAEYLTWLTTEAERNSALQHELADAWRRLARTQPDKVKALTSVNRAVSIAEKSPDGKRSLGAALAQRAEIQASLGRASEARDDLRHSIEILTPLNAHLELATAHEAFANVMAPSDPRLAIRHLQDSLNAWRSVEPRNVAAVGGVNQRMAMLLASTGDADRSRLAYEQAIDSFDRVWVESKNMEARRRRLECTAGLAASLDALGDRQTALERYRERLALAREIVRSDASAESELALALRDTADSSAANGNRADGLKLYSEAAGLFDRLGDREHLGEVLVNSARLMEANPPEAKKNTERGLDMLKGVADGPTVTASQLNLYADALLTCDPAELRNPQGALPYAEAAQKQRHPRYVDTYARALFATGNRQKAIELLDGVLRKYPSNESAALKSTIEQHLDEFRSAR